MAIIRARSSASMVVTTHLLTSVLTSGRLQPSRIVASKSSTKLRAGIAIKMTWLTAKPSRPTIMGLRASIRLNQGMTRNKKSNWMIARAKG